MFDLFSECKWGWRWVGWWVSILPALMSLPAGPETEHLNFPWLWKMDPMFPAEHQNSFLPTSLPRLLPPTPLSVFTPGVLTRSQGILGFVDHTGNCSSVHSGPCYKERGKQVITMPASPIPPPLSSPLHSHRLFVNNIAKRLCSPQARCIHTLPLFYDAWEQSTPCRWELGQSHEELLRLEMRLSRLCRKGQALLKNIKLYISGNLILQGLRDLPYMT